MYVFLFLLQTEDFNLYFSQDIFGKWRNSNWSSQKGLFEGSPLVLSYRLEIFVNHLVVMKRVKNVSSQIQVQMWI